jgi:hypothetical protein
VLPFEIDAFLLTANGATQAVVHGLQEAGEFARKQLNELVQQEVDKSRQEYIERLDHRRNQLSVRPTIHYGGKMIGLQPVNEHEVLILAGKLETALAKHFSEFLILEHTAQIDIDGMMRIRMGVGERLEDPATVEFEYLLENFFEHRHPIRITQYIICWSVGDLKDGHYRFGAKGLHQDGPLTVEIASLEWMKVLKFADYMIYVLPLDQFPGLSILPAK